MKNVALLAMLAGTAILSFGCGGGGGGGGGGNLATCGAFSACGGDITGTWTFDSVCEEGDLASSMMDTSGLPPECSDIIKGMSLQMSGTLNYANGTETSNVNMNMSLKVLYSSACINAQAGTSVVATQSLCDTIASAATSTDGPTMTCKLAGGGCDCTMTMTQDGSPSTDTYTVSGGTLTYSDGKSIEFCVSGNTLSVRSAASSSGAMQFKLHRS